MTTPTPQRILLIGKDGQVGWQLQRTLAPLGRIAAYDHPTLDLGKPDQVRAIIEEVRPTLIVNAAAYTAVDKAEEERDLAMAINAHGPALLAEEAKKLGAAVIHYSTDYVFDGAKGEPYTENDPPHPLNVYGESKLAGDRAIMESGVPHLIFRTSWVYGIRGNNFLRTLLKLFAERDEISIVDDQVGAPTWSRMIAEATAQVLAQCLGPRTVLDLAQASGLYNLTASGETTWYGFAQAIADHASKQHLAPKVADIKPIPSAEYPTPAVRPPYGVLSHKKLQETFGLFIPSWEEQLALCIAPLT
ncbi:MAG TPA: dTDP-4-dehydrorhamnose reductase [Gammaproteobacteria bacterium]|nr:dTDP-4-dehydrorhamnose reductase [Gammaproteobacteria bacterium]